MKDLLKVIAWLTILIGGMMFTGMHTRDWPCVVWVIAWVLAGVTYIELTKASDQDDDLHMM